MHHYTPACKTKTKKNLINYVLFCATKLNTPIVEYNFNYSKLFHKECIIPIVLWFYNLIIHI